MMQNMVPPQQQLPIGEITSPLGAEIVEFCESELFPETLQNSEGASSSNCCYEEHTSYIKPISTNTPAAAPAPAPAGTSSPSAKNNNMGTMLMDDQTVDDISASIDFTLSPTFSVPQDQQYSSNQEPFDMSTMDNQIQLLGDAAAAAEGSLYAAPHLYNSDQQQPMLPPSFPTGEKEDGMQPSHNIRIRSSSAACTLSDNMMGSYLSSTGGTPPFSIDNPWLFFAGGPTPALLQGSDLSHQEMESQGDNGGFFLPDSLARVLNCSSGDLQTLSSDESQQMLNGGPSTNLASEISSLEDPVFKVGKLSAEERKRKIHRYLKKRNERNFSKKIKYACRKTLADSRPRVRGRFAKNDELGELARNAGNNQDDDVDEDINHIFRNSMPDHQHKTVKEEDGVDPSKLFARIREVNSFKCNYPIQSWI